MIATFTARFTKIDSGYLGELIERPEVITEGSDLEDCRRMLEDALHEMIMAYHDSGNHSIYSNGTATIPIKRHNDKETQDQVHGVE
jgi:predicted RNase H-like HicB family nuclease